MIKLKLPYIQQFNDQHGKARYYFRRKGMKRVKLPDPSSPDFLTAYDNARSGKTSSPAPTPPAIQIDGSLSELIASWYETQHFKVLEASTQAVYRRLLERMRGESYSALPVSAIEPKHIKAILKKTGDAPTTANRLLRLLHQLMDYAIYLEWRETNPAFGIKRVQIKSEGIHSWTDAEIEAFEGAFAVGTKARLALALLLYTGQRRSDVVTMGPSNLSGDLISVRQVKTKAMLQIPVHPELRRCLDVWIDVGAGTFLATDSGRSFSVNGFYNVFVAWCAQAGLPKGCSPHGLRKAAARRLAEAGCTTHQIAAITGHRTLAEIVRYTRAVEQVRLAKTAMSMLGESVKPPGKSVKSENTDLKTNNFTEEWRTRKDSNLRPSPSEGDALSS